MEYDINDPVIFHARKDFAVLSQNLTIREALESVRGSILGEKIIYFYAVDDDGKLVGVLPTRKLLTAPLDTKINTIMISKVISIPDSFTVMDACEYFAMYKLLAFPVVDSKMKIVGVVDISLYTEEVFDITEREQVNNLFETLGFRISKTRGASILKLFRLRFVWLIATIACGLTCALLTSLFQITLEKSIILAFFMTLVLGLGESVCVQTMTISIHSLDFEKVSMPWYLKKLRNELAVSFLLGLSCAVIIGIFVYAWGGIALNSLAIGSGIMLSLVAAAVIGLTIPFILHKLKVDLKISAGPIALAMADVFTISIYFSCASLVLG